MESGQVIVSTIGQMGGLFKSNYAFLDKDELESKDSFVPISATHILNFETSGNCISIDSCSYCSSENGPKTNSSWPANL